MATKKTKKKAASPHTESRIIKKYPNRRLYDTKVRAYITLNEIKNYVLEEIEFRVIDAQSGADLTKATLFQVLIEHESAENTFFTITLLQQMIRLYHNNLQTLFSGYFEQALSQFIKQKETWTKQFDLWQTKQSQSTGSASENSSFTHPFSAFRKFSQFQRQFWETLIPKSDKK